MELVICTVHEDNLTSTCSNSRDVVETPGARTGEMKLWIFKLLLSLRPTMGRRRRKWKTNFACSLLSPSSQSCVVGTCLLSAGSMEPPVTCLLFKINTPFQAKKVPSLRETSATIYYLLACGNISVYWSNKPWPFTKTFPGFPFPPWRAVQTYRPHLEVRDPI